MKKERAKFYVDRSSFGEEGAVILMALAIVFRVIGTWGLWNDREFLIWQILLPIASGLLFILCLTLFGRRALWITAIPVLAGVVFFIVKSLDFESTLHTVLCILLYVAVGMLYTATVFGAIPTKWLLVPLFGLPFLYHVFVEDLQAMQRVDPPVSFAAGMQEMSVLCIMLALLFTALAMKKKTPPEPELPKIKAPKVIVPIGKESVSPDDEEAAPETPEEKA